ncbi:MAG TPA: hypothetical protein VFO10_18040 [Oligoflexus sp.]|uniref:hypothetical protein n=1 Tax=Oligoflexus sp. TaxID=1971216 RepID=UPI002D7FF0A8|nr:hypothetical protein [Oligoflexus sp.]HET9239166.1 hypothetical protein [Oligoflexus sp.]
MIIIAREESANTRDMHEFKVQLVVYYLCEYRQTSTALLARLLDQSVHSASGFISNLLKKGILRRLKNPHTKHSLVGLYEGAKPYMPESVDCSLIFKKTVRKNIAHHLAIQEATFKYMHQCSRITYSSLPRAIRKEHTRKPLTENDVPYRPHTMELVPDTLLELKSGKIAALEMELTDKESPNYIYWIFSQYAREIAGSNPLSAVVFVFPPDEKGGETSKTMDAYKRLLAQEHWPVIQRKLVPGHIIYKRTGDYFTPDKGIRKCFLFDIL